MPEIPKIVYDRLRAGLPGGTVPDATHPDPDVLTAFAEHSLSAAERETVLQHMARCGDCRESVALSTPPLESAARPIAAEERESPVPAAINARIAVPQGWWLAWPRLRWAALAAGIIVACGILLIYSGKPAAVQEAKQQSTSVVQQSQETIVAKKPVPVPDDNRNTRNLEREPTLEDRAFSRHKESQLADSASATKVITHGQFGMRPANKQLAVNAKSGPAVGATSNNSTPAPPAPEPAEVTAAQGQVAMEEAENNPSVTGGEVAAPTIISKAKAAKVESNPPSSLQRADSLDTKQVTATARQQGAATSMYSVASNVQAARVKGDLAQVSPQWAIQGNDLQRSLNSGLAWTTVLHSDHPLLSYAAIGSEIWVGGKAGDLFHSTNGGQIWSQVHPSVQQQTLSEDVTHIDISSPAQITLFTDNNRSWLSADGGKTWTKK